MKQQPYTFQVEGTGEFPRDMLKYDDCYPATDEDRVIVDAEFGSADHILFDGTNLRRNRVTLVSSASPDRFPKIPTVARWESFGWDVVPFRPIGPLVINSRSVEGEDRNLRFTVTVSATMRLAPECDRVTIIGMLDKIIAEALRRNTNHARTDEGLKSFAIVTKIDDSH